MQSFKRMILAVLFAPVIVAATLRLVQVDDPIIYLAVLSASVGMLPMAYVAALATEAYEKVLRNREIYVRVGKDLEGF